MKSTQILSSDFEIAPHTHVFAFCFFGGWLLFVFVFCIHLFNKYPVSHTTDCSQRWGQKRPLLPKTLHSTEGRCEG